MNVMPDADLYLDRIDFSTYLSAADCKKCGADSCKELVDRLKQRACRPEDLHQASASRIRALRLALEADRMLPRVPSLQLPRPGAVGLVELNHPEPGDPVLVTGNSELTQEVLLAVLSTTTSPFFLLFTDTRGDSLDMAVILESFTPEGILRSIKDEKLSRKTAPSTLYIPGLAASLGNLIAATTGWPVTVGPVCAAELPMFFGERWLFSEKR